MKTALLAAAALLATGLCMPASAQMMGKCNGGGMQQGNMQGGMMGQGNMMMNGNMQHDRTMMMQHLDNSKACVNAAKSSKELNTCSMQMQKNAPMMKGGMQQGNMQGGMMHQQGGMMGQQGGMMMNGNMQHDRTMMMQHLDSSKACVNAAKSSEELNTCSMQMQQNAPMMNPDMMKDGK